MSNDKRRIETGTQEGRSKRRPRLGPVSLGPSLEEEVEVGLLRLREEARPTPVGSPVRVARGGGVPDIAVTVTEDKDVEKDPPTRAEVDEVRVTCDPDLPSSENEGKRKNVFVCIFFYLREIGEGLT